jgi:hypothetical protein
LVSPIGLGLIFGAALIYALKNFLNDVANGLQRNKEQRERHNKIQSGEADQQTVDKFVERAKAGDVTGQKVGQDFGAKDMPLMGTVNEVLKSKLTDDEIRNEFGVSREVLQAYKDEEGKKGIFSIAKSMGENVKGYEPGTIAIGDKLANDYMSTQKVGGVAKDEATPSQVLSMIKDYAKSNNLRNKTVMLSTGASNNPSEVDAIVPQQIEALKSSGAKPVLLNTSMPEVNNKLQKIADTNKITFDNRLTPAPIPTQVPTPKETGAKVNNSSQELKTNQKKEPSETIIDNKNIQQNDQSKAIPKTSIPSTWDRELVEKLFGKDTKVRIF